VTDLAVGTQVVRTDQIARVDVGRVDELVDLDGPRRLQRQLLELLLGDLDVLSFVEFVALDDVLVRDLVTGIGVDLHVLDR
jgi:hypothetical protein